jgi:hypothetical protein
MKNGYIFCGGRETQLLGNPVYIVEKIMFSLDFYSKHSQPLILGIANYSWQFEMRGGAVLFLKLPSKI